MGGYIRLEKGQIEDPRLYHAASKLALAWKLISPTTMARASGPLDRDAMSNALRCALLGALASLWGYADTHICSDDSLRVTMDGLAAKVGVPIEFLRALPSEWLRERADGYVELPGYCAKNHVRGKDLRKQDLDAKKEHERQLNAERQARHREKKRKEGGNGVTGKTRRYRNAVTPDTGTGTGPLDPTGTVPQRAAARAGSESPAPPRGEETPAVKDARRKLRTLVAGLGAKAKMPT